MTRFGHSVPKKVEPKTVVIPILRVTMKPSSHHSKLHYHTWRDVGGLLGVIFDVAFFWFVVVSAFFMILFCGVLVVLDYLASPFLAALSRMPHRQTA
jgi:hypothetical protein